jgi:hypothetical protein
VCRRHDRCLALSLMNAYDLYNQKYEVQVHERSANLDGMKAATEKPTSQPKLDVKPDREVVQAKRDAAKTNLSAIEVTTDDEWDDVVKHVSRAWGDLIHALLGAMKRLRGRDSGPRYPSRSGIVTISYAELSAKKEEFHSAPMSRP